MSYSLEVEERGRVVRSRLYDDVDLDDSIGLLQALLDRCDSFYGVRIVCDMRGARVKLSFDEMRQVTGFVRTHIARFAGLRWAMVTGSPLVYGLARMAEALSNDLPLEYRVFDNLSTGCNWLGIVEPKATHVG